MTAPGFESFRKRARANLPAVVFDYLEGGADSERGLRRNRETFEGLTLRPRRLVDVSSRDCSMDLLGKKHALPFVIAPTGLNGVLWPDGDIALARAAEKAGIPFALSTASTSTIEEVANKAGGDLWFQLYVIHRDIAREMVGRARDAGYTTLILTADVAVNGRRPREVSRGFKIPFRIGPRMAFDFATHPRWLVRQLWHGLPQLANFASSAATNVEAQAALMARKMDAGFSWDGLRELRDMWPGKLLVKGIVRMDDAHECMRNGADGVILSNHGARQLEDIVSPVTILSELRDQPDYPVLVDSGFREAADCAKALALGAQAVLLGRVVLYGLAAGGEAGVSEVLDMLKTDLDRALALMGAPSVARLDPSYVGM